MRFEGKRVLVTGAASGVGKATAELFAKEGAEVVGVDVTPGEGLVACDLTDPAATRAVVEAHGPFDVVCNVAGIVRLNHLQDVTQQDWDRHLAVNLTAPFVVTQAALPGLIERKGNVVNVASVAGLQGQAYSAAYCASKGGLVLLTKSMAQELAPHGVRVNAVCPGSIDTPLVHGVAVTMPADLDPELMHRFYNVLPPKWSKPWEIAEAIAYLASDVARSVTGSAFSIDGGTLS